MPRTVFILTVLLSTLCLAVPESHAGWLSDKLKDTGKDLGGKIIDDKSDTLYESTKNGAQDSVDSPDGTEEGMNQAAEPPLEEEEEGTPWGGQQPVKKKKVRRSSAKVRTDLHFSADSAGVDPGEEGGSYTGQIFVDGARMRWDMNAKMEDGTVGRTSIVITGAAPEDEIYTLIHGQKMYMVATVASSEEDFWGSFRATDNPCEGYRKAENVGKRPVNGRETIRWECRDPEDSEEPESTDLWIDAKLGIPVRAEDSDGGSFELSNIKENRPPADKFQLPDGYRKISY